MINSINSVLSGGQNSKFTKILLPIYSALFLSMTGCQSNMQPEPNKNIKVVETFQISENTQSVLDKIYAKYPNINKQCHQNGVRCTYDEEKNKVILNKPRIIIKNKDTLQKVKDKYSKLSLFYCQAGKLYGQNSGAKKPVEIGTCKYDGKKVYEVKIK